MASLSIDPASSLGMPHFPEAHSPGYSVKGLVKYRDHNYSKREYDNLCEHQDNKSNKIMIIVLAMKAHFWDNQCSD